MELLPFDDLDIPQLEWATFQQMAVARHGDAFEYWADTDGIADPDNLIIAIFKGGIIYRGVMQEVYFGTDGVGWIGADKWRTGFALFHHLGKVFCPCGQILTRGDLDKLITPVMKRIVPKMMTDPKIFGDLT